MAIAHRSATLVARQTGRLILVNCAAHAAAAFRRIR
jgi:hypothetical protein